MKTSTAIKQLVVGQMAENCYLLIDQKTKETVIVDPGDDPEYIMDVLNKEDARPVSIVATHGHFDHIMGAFALQMAYQIPFCIHESDRFLILQMSQSAKHFLKLDHVDPPPEPKIFLTEGGNVSFGQSRIDVLHVPGHTPGSICLLLPHNSTILVGDLVFAQGGVGRTDFSYSDRSKLELSLKRVLSFPGAFALYPGHGGPTTVENEREFHPFVKAV